MGRWVFRFFPNWKIGNLKAQQLTNLIDSVDHTYQVNSIFFPLHPTPYSLLPTPYSLLPTPFALTNTIEAIVL
ncbi:hypothetical protein [Moorena sp. SIO3H5]|uniref:hypothetical protein n=1 Tax=Moorena sp. SIO3H5 TaxID=2607834 RepID=UPI0013BC0DC2|nr:hypothetical protein [Moorena sp. SIO3H5]NEO74418.1 hypothetical protein [Moorena sp. SIO3H5]